MKPKAAIRDYPRDAARVTPIRRISTSPLALACKSSGIRRSYPRHSTQETGRSILNGLFFGWLCVPAPMWSTASAPCSRIRKKATHRPVLLIMADHFGFVPDGTPYGPRDHLLRGRGVGSGSDLSCFYAMFNWLCPRSSTSCPTRLVSIKGPRCPETSRLSSVCWTLHSLYTQIDW